MVCKTSAYATNLDQHKKALGNVVVDLFDQKLISFRWDVSYIYSAMMAQQKIKLWYLVHLVWISYGKNNICDHSPLTLSPSSFCLSGRTPVRLLMDCFRSITVSSSDRELMEYSWPPHFMITDTDMALTGSSHTYTHYSWKNARAHTSAHPFKLKYFQLQ